AFPLKPDLAAARQPGRDGIGIKNCHNPGGHANLQDSRSALVGEERSLTACGRLGRPRAARSPVADDGRETFRRWETPAARFPVDRVRTIRLDAAGTLKRRAVMENGRGWLGRQGKLPQLERSL